MTPAEVIAMRDELAQTIYDLLNPSFQQGEKWLETADGTGNRQSYWLAGALIESGWVTAPPKNEGEKEI